MDLDNGVRRAIIGENHRRVVDDHVVELDTMGLVLFCDPAEGVQEQPIAKLHDVCLVHTCDFLKLQVSEESNAQMAVPPCGCS